MEWIPLVKGNGRKDRRGVNPVFKLKPPQLKRFAEAAMSRLGKMRSAILSGKDLQGRMYAKLV
jgi:hypothetical protein